MPIAGDLRRADIVITSSSFGILGEAETRLYDVQALERRIGGKQRDLGLERVILLLADTATNRRTVASLQELARRFPISARSCLAALAEGRDPGGRRDPLPLKGPAGVRDGPVPWTSRLGTPRVPSSDREVHCAPVSGVPARIGPGRDPIHEWTACRWWISVDGPLVGTSGVPTEVSSQPGATRPEPDRGAGPPPNTDPCGARRPP